MAESELAVLTTQCPRRRDETHICVLDREGAVVYEASVRRWQTRSRTSCRRRELSSDCIRETGRMVPILFHGLNQLGLPVVCVESRQAYQALKSLATHKTDRKRRARAGAFGSHWLLQAGACEVIARPRPPLVDYRAQETGRAASDFRKPDPWPCGRVRGPTAPRAHRRLSSIRLSKQARGSLVSPPPCGARTAVMTAVAAIDADMRRMIRASAACRRLMTIQA